MRALGQWISRDHTHKNIDGNSQCASEKRYTHGSPEIDSHRHILVGIDRKINRPERDQSCRHRGIATQRYGQNINDRQNADQSQRDQEYRITYMKTLSAADILILFV